MKKRVLGKFPIVCANCKKIFNVPYWASKTAKYCSKECRKEFFESSNITLVCLNCKIPFIRKQYQINSSHKGQYCSRRCYLDKDITYAKCPCGKEFRVSPSRAKMYKILYCSKECKRTYVFATHFKQFFKEEEYNEILWKLTSTKEFVLWRKKCLKRDKYKCTVCKSKESLIVHHRYTILQFFLKHGLNFKKIFKDKLFLDINNGLTVCRGCHFIEHRKKGERNVYCKVNKKGKIRKIRI